MTKYIRFDWGIKYLFRNKANFDILEGFLSELLSSDITIESILESEGNQESKSDKFNRVDLLVRTGDGSRITIEVQSSTQWDYLSRILYGTSKVITEYLKLGEPYKNVCNVISVNVVFFDLGQGSDYIYRGITSFKGVHNGDTLGLDDNEIQMYQNKKRVPEDIFPEYYIIKVNQFDQRIKNKFDEWMYFLKNEVVKPEFNAKGIHAAANKLDILKLNDDDRQKYNRYAQQLSYESSMVESHYGLGKAEGLAKGKAEGKAEGLTEGIEKGIAKGIEEGQQTKALELARNLWRMSQSSDLKMTDEQIVKTTGITQEQMDRIKLD